MQIVYQVVGLASQKWDRYPVDSICFAWEVPMDDDTKMPTDNANWDDDDDTDTGDVDLDADGNPIKDDDDDVNEDDDGDDE